MSPWFKLNRYLSEIAVTVYILLLVAVLQLVVLDVEPQSLHDAGPSLRVHAQETGQTWVQFILRRLKWMREETIELSQRIKQISHIKEQVLPDGPA